ncbi:ATP-binding cassette domain-containing protein (plasmid) [Arthrobacter citreus]|nr:ATP-binding cassette domain-containing protein [Arthrobacter citreus]
MSDLILEISGLQKRFGKQIVLDGLDLTVKKGEILALLGPNGAGKTTLINVLSTLITPDDGKITLNGFDMTKNSLGVKNSISLTGQFAAVDEILTAKENLLMMGELSGLSKKEAHKRADFLLDQFELKESAKKQVKTFSGGMRRRLDLAISLVVKRPLLFLDEPTTGLDTKSRRALWEIIHQLKDDGVTVLLTTQYLEEADQLADTIVFLANGRIIASGTPAEMKKQIGGTVIEVRDFNDEIIQEISTNGSIDEIKRAIHHMDAELPNDSNVYIRRPSLDDVFLTLTNTRKESN